MGLNQIRDKIYRECNQKVINGVGLTCKMFTNLLKSFVESFNSGKVPAIETAWHHLIESEIENTFNNSKTLFDDEI